jgi:serine/threonine protein kinase
MDTPALPQELNPIALPPGARVGAWRVDSIQGRGSYGTVYRAVHPERIHAGPVALKLAIYPEDPRFEREVELLSRIRHPSVPRLLGSGQWHSPLGKPHPFVVMEWVEGVPLYAWAAWRGLSSRQVLALLAQAARALQATHEVSAVHRDVKGDNMLVRPSNGRLFLTDFGTGYFAGATRLTPLGMLTGTPDYLSPQLWEQRLHAEPGTTSPVSARPSDDVFALGVTAYRLVTDEYPPSTHPAGEQARCWLPDGRGAPPPRQLNPRVDAQLNALILRMLSPKPEERGTAGELAEAMERGVAHAPPSADEPLLSARAWTTVRARPVKTRRWLPWLAAAMTLGLWPEETNLVHTVEQPPLAHGAAGNTQRKEESVSLGDTAMDSPATVEKSSSSKAVALELPKEPLPGQIRPDANGRCPQKQIPINGGCWGKVDFDVDHCLGNLFVYRDGCYAAAYEPARKPTSAPWQSEP